MFLTFYDGRVNIHGIVSFIIPMGSWDLLAIAFSSVSTTRLIKV